MKLLINLFLGWLVLVALIEGIDAQATLDTLAISGFPDAAAGVYAKSIVLSTIGAGAAMVSILLSYRLESAWFNTLRIMAFIFLVVGIGGFVSLGVVVGEVVK